MEKKDFLTKEEFSFDDFAELVRFLRAPDGCPWDREQTHKSIRANFIEETYEAVEGIDREDPKILREELGDVMLQVLLHAVMEEEAGNFTVRDVINDICRKLVFRHPHVFGDRTAGNADEAIANWDELKKKEKGQKDALQSIRSVSPALPSLMRAEKLYKKAKKNGLIPSCAADETADAAGTGEKLFDLCALCAENGWDAEQILYEQNERFISSLQDRA